MRIPPNTIVIAAVFLLLIGVAEGQTGIKGGQPVPPIEVDGDYDLSSTAVVIVISDVFRDDDDAGDLFEGDNVLITDDVGAAINRSEGTASSTGTMAVQYVVNPADGGVSGTASVSASASLDEDAENVSRPDLFAEGSAEVFLLFDVSGGGAMITVGGNAEVMSQGNVQLEADVDAVLDNGFETELAVFRTSTNANVPISHSTTLERGSYRIVLQLDVDALTDFDEDFSSGSISATISVNFTLTPIPSDDEEDDVFFWAGLNGAFDDETNWEPEGVPGSGNTAIFDRDQSYIVSMGMEESARAIVERGEVRFSGDQLTLGGGDVDDPSLVVGNTAADFAYLGLDVLLNTVHGAVGAGPVAEGEVEVASNVWNNQGNLEVGVNGVGMLRIHGPGRVTSGALVIGVFSGGDGLVDLGGAAGMKQTEALTAGNVAVGLAGTGRLEVREAFMRAEEVRVGAFGTGRVTVELGALETGAVAIGSGEGGMGEVMVSGRSALPGRPPGEVDWSAQSVTVGGAGTGVLTVDEGFGFGSAGDIRLGVEPGATAMVTVRGITPPFLQSNLGTLDGDMEIGVQGRGNLHVLDGGVAGANNIHIGVAPLGELGGAVLVSGTGPEGDRSTLLAFETLRIGLAGLFEGQNVGDLVVLEGGVVRCRNAIAGQQNGVNQLIVLETSEFLVEEAFVAGNADATTDPPVPLTEVRIFNAGLIQAESITMEVGTVLLGGGVYSAETFIDFAGVLDPGPPDPEGGKGAESFGVIVFDGDFRMERGVMNIDVGGVDPGQTDGVVITGDGDIGGVGIHFNFVDGYLPRTGDALAFLEVMGNLTLGNVEASYSGAAAGFEFDLMDDNGVLTFQALNDAEPDPDAENGDGPQAGCFSAGTGGGGSDSGLGWLLVALVVAALAVDGARWRRARGED